MSADKPTVHNSPTRAPRAPSKATPETIAMRRIGRVLDELEEPSRSRVVGAIKSLYMGPAGQERA
jgi:hypothetical protein